MDEERDEKIELEASKTKAETKKSTDSSSGSSTPSLVEKEMQSDSSISEHVVSSGASIENDRSFQEIIISNIPSLAVHSEDEIDHISQENKPASFISYKSDSVSGGTEARHVQSILEEILKNEQFASDSEHTVFNNSHESSLNIFENVNLDDSYVLRKQVSGVKEDESDQSSSKIRHLEELVAAKDTTIAVLTNELDSIRDLNSNPSTISLGTTTTEYKQLHEECYGRIVEYQNAVSYRDNIIQQLTDSLQQSLHDREDLKQQTEVYAAEIVNLQQQVSEATLNISKHKCFRDKDDYDTNENKDVCFEKACTELEADLSPEQRGIFKRFKTKVDAYVLRKISELSQKHIDEIKTVQDKMENEKKEQNLEIARLRELLSSVKCGSTEIIELKQELEAKHAREMEDLRIFFEKKCTEMEKHYSEEVFSQQSRKMSGSSTGSDVELTSDLLYSGSHPQLGPGGDSGQLSFEEPLKRDQNVLTPNDLIVLKQDLSNMLTDLDKYDLNSMSKQDITNLTIQLNKYKLNSLIKCDLAALRSEMQNKYHAELEILREDYENRIDLLNVEHEKNVQDIERKYVDKIESLKFDLNEALRGQLSISSAVQEVSSSGEFEIGEVVQSYERRLQEQVTLAKYDIISALESQIQRLVANEGNDEEWPSELLQLRDRFCNKYEQQMTELKEEHEKEINQIKEEHRKILNGALRRRSLKDGDSFNHEEQDLITKERDNMKKTNQILRHLLSELIKYFTQCEDELNNTIVDELLKHGFDKNLTQIEGELDMHDSITNEETKRVHFTPDFTEFMSFIDGANPISLDSTDLSMDLKNELGSCLEKLRTDANAILAMTNNLRDTNDNNKTSNSLEKKVTSLTRQLINETQLKNDLKEQLDDINKYVGTLEIEKENLEVQLEQLIAKQNVLEADLGKAKEKIHDLIESGHKETVTEGYGENATLQRRSSSGKLITLSELQEKARVVVAEFATSTDHPLINLIDELCHEGERIKDDAKKDHDDLQQQIEAADKKYKALCNFLEEQAGEREQERDEAQKEIASLHDQLRNRDKDRASCERINNEVEQLEKQMFEMSTLIEHNELKYQETDKERRDAIDKISDLRGIICNLEGQIETKNETERELRFLINELESIVKQQTKSNEELNEQLDSIKTVPDAQHFQEQIILLEGEVQRLRLSTELVGNEGAFIQIANQLTEIENIVEKQTKELEGLHSTVSGTTCSSPSEDMSIRDQVRSHTPISTLEECEVPLQQLARLREKLMKHSRAEDAAVKKIRDLEMQLSSSRHDYEESLHERDILQDQVAEQLMLISSLQIRLDEQRLLVENAEKQNNSSLEGRIYDLENELQGMRETLRHRDKTIKQLGNTLEETKKRLEEREEQIKSANDNDVIIGLKKQIETLLAENFSLKTAAESTQILPNLVDNIIADKNADIEKLRGKLSETQRELDSFLSLNLDREQLHNLSKLKSTDRGFTNLLSLVDFESEQARKAESKNSSLNSLPPNLKHFNDTTLEMSCIEKIGPSNINYTLEAPLIKPNSTEISKPPEKRVHFKDLETERLFNEISSLKSEINKRDEIIKEYMERLNLLSNVEDNIKRLQRDLESTEHDLKKATETFEKEQNASKELEKDLRMELAEKKMHLTEKDKRLDELIKEAERNDQVCINLAKEKRALELKIEALQSDELMNESNILKLRIESLEAALKDRSEELASLKQKMIELEQTLHKKSEDYESLLQGNRAQAETNSKLIKELQNGSTQTDSLNNEISKLNDLVGQKNVQIEGLETELKRLRERESEIENGRELNESKLQLQLSQSRKETAEKGLSFTRLKTDYDDLYKEHAHLQTLLLEKDKIIQQMSEDSKSLHVNLETIQNKMLETGNILDLSKRLRDELKLNSELQVEIQTLKKMLSEQEAGKAIMTTSIEEITGQVRRELDYSAQIDSNIISALSTDDFEITDIETLKESLKKERALNRLLIKQKEALQNDLHGFERQLVMTKSQIRTLQIDLEKEKLNCDEIQLEDAKLIEQLRIRLDSALDNETEFEKMLETEKQARMELESQISAFKKKASNLNSSSNSKTDRTEYKSLPNIEMTELRHELQAAKEENLKLKSELKSLKRARSEAETNHRYTKDVLNLKNAEIAKLENEMKGLRQAEDALKEVNIEMKVQLEQKIREVENSRILIDEMEEDRVQAKKQIDSLNKKLREYRERERRLHEVFGEDDTGRLNSPLPDQVLRKIKELTGLVRDNKKMTETMARLTEERRALQERVKDLEGRNAHLPFDDPAARANHLFGRYLRSESYRKALIWQKRYLILLLATYQDFRPITERLPLSTFTAKANRAKKSHGKSRFRSVVTVIISIYRLKYLVQRWHSGKRFAREINARYGTNQSADTGVTVGTGQFQVGQPVSSQHFSTRPFYNFNTIRASQRHILEHDVAGTSGANESDTEVEARLHDLTPWSGKTPPSKDKPHPNTRSTAHLPRENLTPLRAPELLAHYVERFNQIQTRLSMNLNPPS